MIGYIYKFYYNKLNICYINHSFNPVRDEYVKLLHSSKNKDKSILNFYINYFGINQFKIKVIKLYKVVDELHLIAYKQLYINTIKNINDKNIYLLHLNKFNKKITRSYKRKFPLRINEAAKILVSFK